MLSISVRVGSHRECLRLAGIDIGRNLLSFAFATGETRLPGGLFGGWSEAGPGAGEADVESAALGVVDGVEGVGGWVEGEVEDTGGVTVAVDDVEVGTFGDGISVDLAGAYVVDDIVVEGFAADVNGAAIGGAAREQEAIVLDAGGVPTVAPAAEPVGNGNDWGWGKGGEAVGGDPAGEAVGGDAGLGGLGAVEADDGAVEELGVSGFDVADEAGAGGAVEAAGEGVGDGGGAVEDAEVVEGACAVEVTGAGGGAGG